VKGRKMTCPIMTMQREEGGKDRNLKGAEGWDRRLEQKGRGRGEIDRGSAPLTSESHPWESPTFLHLA